MSGENDGEEEEEEDEEDAGEAIIKCDIAMGWELNSQRMGGKNENKQRNEQILLIKLQSKIESHSIIEFHYFFRFLPSSPDCLLISLVYFVFSISNF